MSRTRPTRRFEDAFDTWRAAAGRPLLGIAVGESLFDVIALPAEDLVQVGERRALALLVRGLEVGAVVRLDNDPPVGGA